MIIFLDCEKAINEKLLKCYISGGYTSSNHNIDTGETEIGTGCPTRIAVSTCSFEQCMLCHVARGQKLTSKNCFMLLTYQSYPSRSIPIYNEGFFHFYTLYACLRLMTLNSLNHSKCCYIASGPTCFKDISIEWYCSQWIL